ncbi:MAG TPA: hypothetical protein ENI80_05130 [Acidiferrobacteraceae bacterium]|nr:hypothetical protein [Acidiferrobacteraceae bacterium]
MKKLFFFLSLFILIFSMQTRLSADTNTVKNVKKAFDKAMEYVEKGNYVKANKELDWAKKDIDKLHIQRLLTYLKDELAGFKGKPVKSTAVLGMMAVERDYKKGNTTVKVSITTVGAGLGAFSQIATMAQRSNPNAESFRVGDHTGIIEAQSGRTAMTVFLEAGPFLKLEMRGAGEKKILYDMLGEISVDELNKYLKGEG